MFSRILQASAILTVLFAIFYQYLLKDILFSTPGIGRPVQPLSDFPYTCRRLRDPKLEACEDLWLDDEERILYAACSGTIARKEWGQVMGSFNHTGRRSQGSELIALSIDTPGPSGLFNPTVISPVGYAGALGPSDTTLDLLGFTADVVSPSRLRFYLVNQRPPVDANRQYLSIAETKKVGANATIEVFEMERGAKGRDMRHVQTVVDEGIYSPNRVVTLGDRGFLLSNDRSAKVGIRKELDILLGGGNIIYCPPSTACTLATPATKLYFPNGILLGHDNLLYIPSSFHTGIDVMAFNSSSRTLTPITTIPIPIPLDNLSVDTDGVIWAAGFPRSTEMFAVAEDPLGKAATAAVWKISKDAEGEYVVEKVVEDGRKEVMSGVTTVVHDVKKGRLFMGSAFSPFLVVCEPK